MPRITRRADQVSKHGDGWEEAVLANTATMGAPAMAVHRWTLQSGAAGPSVLCGDREEWLYVIRGSGSAIVGAERLPLKPETVVWLQPNDRYHLEAGPQGLEALRTCAPGEP